MKAINILWLLLMILAEKFRFLFKRKMRITEEEWNINMTTNLTGLWLVSKYVCRRMRDAKQKGSVINISSIAGLERGQLPRGVAYSASKAGVNSVTKVTLI